MKWEITINVEQKYVEIITRGNADGEGSLKMAKAIAETMRQNKITKALIDHSHVDSVSGHVVDVYQRPKIFKLIGVILGIKIAEIIKPEHRAHFKFFETVCLNQGYNLSVFHDRDSAMNWLLGKV